LNLGTIDVSTTKYVSGISPLEEKSGMVSEDEKREKTSCREDTNTSLQEKIRVFLEKVNLFYGGLSLPEKVVF